MEPRNPGSGLLLILFLIVGLPLALGADSRAPVPRAANGRMDLSSHDFDRDGPVALDGAWDFFWGRFVTSGDQMTQPSIAAYLPEGLWQNLMVAGKVLPTYGFATYRLRVVFPAGEPEMALKMPEAYSACRVLLNGAEIFDAGKVGTPRGPGTPFYKTGIVEFTPRTGENEILVQVSNYWERRGGLNRSLVVGLSTDVGNRYFQALALDVLIFGILLAMGVYHLCLFLIRRRDLSPLWFGLFCLAIALRTLLYGERFLFQLFPDLPWSFFQVGDHLTFYLGIPLFAEYVRLSFLRDISTRFIRAYQILGAAFSIFLFFPPEVFNTTVVGYELITAAAVVYILAVIITALVRHREGSLVSIIGVGLFFLCGVNEILFNLGVIPTFNTLSLGLVIFLFSQAILLAVRFSKAFTETERLGLQLLDTNTALRRFIPQEFFQILECEQVTDIRLGDQVQKNMSVMFSDIRGFTALAEALTATETFAFLNSYYGRVGQVMRQHGGFIDKYVGDGFMTLFPNRPDDALRAAVDLQKTVAEYNIHRNTSGYAPITVGTGLHYGPLILGTIGEKDRMDTTVIADAVNLSSRLEGLTKIYGRGTIVTIEFLDALDNPDAFHWRYLGVIRVPGRRESIEAVHVYDGIPEPEWQTIHESKVAFEEALAVYRTGAFIEAQAAFLDLAGKYPSDPASTAYLTRISLMLKAGLTQDWDGVDTILSK